MIGTSLTVQQAKEVIFLIRKDIDSLDILPPIHIVEIDWGPKKRGQGKRVGSTIKGSMSAAPVGIKKYQGYDISEYKSDWDGNLFKLLHGHQLVKYYKARKFGCNEIESRYYALTEK